MSSKFSEVINIKNVIADNIISMEISISIMFFLFNTRPNIPVKNKINDKLIFFYLCAFNKNVFFLGLCYMNIHAIKLLYAKIA